VLATAAGVVALAAVSWLAFRNQEL
jgi:hypothetical protein